jgi:hypothetical protein
MLRYELADPRHQLLWDFHDGRPIKRSLVLRHGLFVCLRLVVCQDPLDPGLVPPRRKLVLPHSRYFLRRRRLKAWRAFPSRVYERSPQGGQERPPWGSSSRECDGASGIAVDCGGGRLFGRLFYGLQLEGSQPEACSDWLKASLSHVRGVVCQAPATRRSRNEATGSLHAGL